MDKNKFTTEYELRASPKMLYPYVSTASGLSQWFADDVSVNEDKVYSFVWDGVEHKAVIAAQRINSYIKFQFIENGSTKDNAGDKPGLPFVEFKLDTNELTQSVFLKVTDYSDTADEEELEDLWSNLISNLKEIVGG
jgi:uncharacterized protein YndB with AHSA1/START domain